MSEESTMNLVQKLAKIRALSASVKKSKKGYNYSYTDITEILASVTTGMKKYGVSLIPSMTPETGRVTQNVICNTKIDKTGKPYEQKTTEMLFCADMVFTWIDNDNPEDKLVVPWFAAGSMTDASQAIGASLSYNLRQFLTSFFQIAQVDTDVDAYRSKQKEAEKSEEKAIAEAIVGEVDKAVKSYLASNADKREEVTKLISKYVKGADYRKITDPQLAAKLLSDFKDTYTKGE